MPFDAVSRKIVGSDDKVIYFVRKRNFVEIKAGGTRPTSVGVADTIGRSGSDVVARRRGFSDRNGAAEISSTVGEDRA